MSLGVVGARRGFRMVLDGKNRVFAVPDPLDRAVIEVQMGHFERLCAWDGAGLTPDGKAVILGGDKYLSRRKIAYGMVPAAVSVRQLDRLAAHRQTEQLMAEADPEDRERPVRQLANRRDLPRP